MRVSHSNDERKRVCTFLTLFPTSISVQFTIILTCYEQVGWYPTHLILHPERYERCDHLLLYFPVPQERIHAFLQAQRAGTPLPLLDDVIEVTLHPDTTQTLPWYQVQCLAEKAQNTWPHPLSSRMWISNM